jgi:hypothetical protein
LPTVVNNILASLIALVPPVVNIVNSFNTVNNATCFEEDPTSSFDESQTTVVPSETEDTAQDDAFRATYATFLPHLKWKLPSGATVEDTLYRNYNSHNSRLSSEVRTSIRNWIVMVDSQEMEDLFLPQDWQDILQHVKPLPQVEDTVLRYLARFLPVRILEDTWHFYSGTRAPSSGSIDPCGIASHAHNRAFWSIGAGTKGGGDAAGGG